MSNHWYDKQGNPVYTIIGTNGKERNTTLRDAKKLDLVPSVTTILQVISRPQLDNWKQQQLLKAAYECRGFKQEFSQWSAIILRKSQEISLGSSKRGSEIHDQLEKWFKTIHDQNMEMNFLTPVINCVLQLTKDPISWIPEKSFSSQYGFGGKVDLHNQDIVIDFKTKSKNSDFTKNLGYDEHCMQLAAYRLGLDIPKARCYNIFISTESPGLVQLKEWSEIELERGLKMFLSLLNYWRLSNDIKD